MSFNDYYIGLRNAHDAYIIRQKIYVEENNFLPNTNGDIEYDEYDEDYNNSVVYRAVYDCNRIKSYQSIAVVRVLKCNGIKPLPFERFSPETMTGAHWGEVSRIGILKASKLTPSERREVMVCLFKAVYTLSLDQGISHWGCMMPASLQMRMSILGVDFFSVGEPVEYHGLRNPCVGVAHRVLSSLEVDNPEMYNFILSR